MNWQNRHLYQEAVRLLALSGTDSLLDIGCGNGNVLHTLARQFDCAFTGIDTSASMLALAVRRNRAYIKNSKMTLLCQNVNAMSFADHSFSKAYTINTVYFWENLDDTMIEIGRVLKPGGLFMNTLYTDETLSRFSFTQFGYKRFTPEQLTNAGIHAGFTAELVPIMNGAAYCVLYRKAN